MLGDVRRYGNYFVAVIFFTVGLLLLDAIRMPLPGAVIVKRVCGALVLLGGLYLIYTAR